MKQTQSINPCDDISCGHVSRRKFLQNAALATGAAAFGFPNLLRAVEDLPKNGEAVLAVMPDETGFIPLFDGKTLNGWTSARNTGAGNWGDFTVNAAEKAIHVYAGKGEGSKQEINCLNTEKEYSHYILKLDYKWGGKRFAPRADWDRDAGLLFHVHGDLTKVWPNGLEMQIGETPGAPAKGNRFHTGDLFVIGGNLQVERPVKDGFYHPEGARIMGLALPTKLGVEKPRGEWNEMEIRVEGAEKATFIFNGEVVFEIFNMQQKIGNDFLPLDKGRIGLQAEFAEVLYRNIRIKELPSK